jgi:hypothetical protein
MGGALHFVTVVLPSFDAASSPARSARAVHTLGWAAVVGVLVTLGWGTAGCGASVSRRYESDVRFERCLALDWKQDADPAVQHRCWLEWSTYYAEGQTRDRIEHARAMLTQLDRGELGGGRSELVATPDPTSAFAPPPMMFSASSATPSPPAAPSVGPPVDELSPCESRCEANIAACLSRCRGDACERACTSRFVPCLKRCER